MIPVRCTRCGRPISCNWTSYCEEVRRRKLAKSEDLKKIVYLSKENQEKTVEGHVLDELQMKSDCCRIAFITAVDSLGV